MRDRYGKKKKLGCNNKVGREGKPGGSRQDSNWLREEENGAKDGAGEGRGSRVEMEDKKDEARDIVNSVNEAAMPEEEENTDEMWEEKEKKKTVR